MLEAPSGRRPQRTADEVKNLKLIRSFCVAVTLVGTSATGCVQAQRPTSTLERSPEGTVPRGLDDVSLPGQGAQRTSETTDGKSSLPDAPTPQLNPGDSNSSDDQKGKQPKRILGIIPNYRAVGANAHLPPLRFKEKFWLATQDTFDYSDFIFVGGLAGISMAQNSEPSFGQDAAGYGRYYWHIFVDGGMENYMTEAIVPTATKEDPRYYTLGEGGLIKRTGYAVSRLFITRTDTGKNTFNISEIVGAGAAAGIGNAYYPTQSNTWVKTYQRWGTQVPLDGLFNVLKEFWPDINQAVFRGKY
jgi:hypothetical protein